MVSAVTQHTASFVEWEMPMAKGLQFQAIYLELHGTTTTRAASAGPSTLSRYL